MADDREEGVVRARGARAGLGVRDAPESTDIVQLQDRYGLFIGGEFVEPKSGKWFATINPATEELLAEVAEAGPEDVDLAVARRAQGLRGSAGATSPGASARSTSTGSRAQLQERAREFAVLETMNGGKPIKESRDVDLPLAAAHFFYYAGLGRQARVRVPGPLRPSRSAWRARSSRGTSRC